jgi:hypothetical protein
MKTASLNSPSDLVRQHAVDAYLSPARRRREKTVTINVGAVHKALQLGNRVPLVCTALESQKFLKENRLRLISKTGPPSGQSTTVIFTYEFLESGPEPSGQDAWHRLRGTLKDVFAELGGGEAYLRGERDSFRDPSDGK